MTRYERLIGLLNRYSYEYHTLDQPSVSDSVYDSLFDELRRLETKNPAIVRPDSPSQRVGDQVSAGFTKVSHHSPMLGLNDVFEFAGVEAWRQRLAKLQADPGELDYFLDPKMDGLALAVVYEDGQLVQAITRGDGRTGEDVTTNARTIRNLPLSLPEPQTKTLPRRLEVRGEVIINKRDFKRLNAARHKEGQATYANARNTAAGAMRQLDPRQAAARPLIFRAYDLIGDHWSTQSEVLATLARLNFSHNRQATVLTGLEAVKRWLRAFDKQRQRLPFATDGVVIRLNDRRLFADLGIVGRSPRGALAYKYPAAEATTVIEDIRLQIGRSGNVTPVAICRPVALAGSTVSRASLHNADEIERLDVRPKDTVVIYKAGDIIPKIKGVVTDLRPKNTKPFDFWGQLRRQHPRLEFVRAGVIYRLRSGQEGRLLALAIEHYASRPALDISGLGAAVSRALVTAGLVTSLSDIYNLTVSDLLPLPKFADKSASNLVAAIKASRRPELARFILALGISGVGQQTAADLAGHCRNLANFKRLTGDKLLAIPDIGPITAQSITDWLATDSNQALLEHLAQLGVRPRQVKPSASGLAGLNFVISGQLAGYSRQALAARIAAAGGRLQTQVGKTTDYLVVGQNPGQQKRQQAASLGTKVIGEAEFFRLLG